jgi:hypothetical protein
MFSPLLALFFRRGSFLSLPAVVWCGRCGR